jgi:hypothetical protein
MTWTTPSSFFSSLSKNLQLPVVTLPALQLTRLPEVEGFEIDELGKCLAQGRSVIITQGRLGAGRCEERGWKARLAEARSAKEDTEPSAGRVEQGAAVVAWYDGRGLAARSDPCPQAGQPFHVIFRCVAGNNGGIYGTDRYAGNPLRFLPRRCQRFLGAGLLGPQPTTDLDNENRLFIAMLHCSNMPPGLAHGE